jgi:hypothetical protein
MMPTPIEAIEAELPAEILAGRAEHRAELLRAMDFKAYLWSFGGHERFKPFLEIEHLLSDKQYWKCVALVWSNIEVSSPNQREWLRLFESKRPHRELLISAAERRALAAMPDTLRIYRGYAKGRARRGISWTLSERRAHKFANYAIGPRRALLCGHKSGGFGMVAPGQCHKRDVLAYFNGRREQEIVIRPENVSLERRSWHSR